MQFVWVLAVLRQVLPQANPYCIAQSDLTFLSSHRVSAVSPLFQPILARHLFPEFESHLSEYALPKLSIQKGRRSSRTARAIQRNPVSNTPPQNKTKQNKTKQNKRKQLDHSFETSRHFPESVSPLSCLPRGALGTHGVYGFSLVFTGPLLLVDPSP